MLNLKVVAGVIVCGLMTGCGGFATSEDISEVRSILEELEVVEKKPVKTDDVAQNDSTQDNTNDNNDNDTVDAGDQNPAPTPTEPEVVEQTPTPAPAPTEQAPITLVSASLSWQPAAFYEDGTVMSPNDISHYQIVYGESQTQLDQTVDVSLSGILSYEFQEEAGTTWYVAVRTVSVYGGVSESSNVLAFNF